MKAVEGEAEGRLKAIEGEAEGATGGNEFLKARLKAEILG